MLRRLFPKNTGYSGIFSLKTIYFFISRAVVLSYNHAKKSRSVFRDTGRREGVGCLETIRLSMADHSDEGSYIRLTANIVSAYVSNNTVSSAEIPALISQIYSALMRVSNGAQVAAPAEPLKPAVPIKRSITPEYLVCLEDGKKFKSLKRHLRTQYGMTPDQYRAKWNLAADYPMVAPNYAAARSQLAKQMGLGQQRRRRRDRG